MKLGKQKENHSIFAVMKHVLLAAILSLLCLKGMAQEQSVDSLPYRKHPELPSFEILTEDSSDKFNTYYIKGGKPILLIYFGPDCSHCIDLGKEMVAHKDALKNTRIYMITPLKLADIPAYKEKTGLRDMKNITYGKDFNFFVISFYGVNAFPFAAVYDGDKKLVKGFDKNFKVEQMLEAVEQAR